MIGRIFRGAIVFFRLPLFVSAMVFRYFLKRVFSMKASDHEIIWTSFFYYSCQNRLTIKKERHTCLIHFNWHGQKLKISIRKNNSSDIFVFFQVFIKEEYEPFFEKLKHVKPAGYCLDAGANAGYFSIACACRFPYVKLCAIEPDPDNFKILTENIRLNSFDERIFPFLFALWTTRQTLVLVKDGLQEWAYRVSSQPVTGTTCQGITLREIANQAKTEGFPVIKMDIEGAEHELFDNHEFVDNISKSLLLGIEIHNNPDRIIAQLKSMNFSIEKRGELTLAAKKAS